jgi:putative toxin-antitoxin system antitoxin component (TIGR02293 family)
VLSETAPAKRFPKLVRLIANSGPLERHDYVHAGIPPSIVDTIVDGTGATDTEIRRNLGLPTTTLKRKKAEDAPLSEAQGARLVGFIELAAKVDRMLEESGDPDRVKDFNVGVWLHAWMSTPNPELNGQTPFSLMTDSKGQRIVETLLVVPSVVIPDEHCVLINPEHPDAKLIAAKKTRRFLCDPRV